MDPKSLPRTSKHTSEIDPKSIPALKRLLLETQGLVLEVQGPILELKTFIFGGTFTNQSPKKKQTIYRNAEHVDIFERWKNAET